MPRIRPVALPLAILSILLLSTLSFAAAPDRITTAIAAEQTVRLLGGVPLQARPEFDQGPVDPSTRLIAISLLTVPSAAQKKALAKLLADQQNPRSDSYHKWLTPEQYADRFGLSPNDARKINEWLQSEGFTVLRTARGRNWIRFSGTVGQVEKTFGAEIDSFSTNGQTHFANIAPPTIPASLSGIVTALRGLNNFPAKSNAHRSQPDYTISIGGSPEYLLGPGDISAMYDISTLIGNGIDGSGQTLAVIGETDVYLPDLNDFRSGFKITQINNCTTNGAHVITSCSAGNFEYSYADADAGPDPGVPNSLCPDCDDLPEADLDLEWSNAVARKATIAYVNAPLTGVFTSLYAAIDNSIAPVITMSYTTPCELGEIGYFDSDEAELQMANSLGITVMNSSGDTGAAECDFGDPSGVNLAIYGYAVAYPASSVYVTGVGGTSIPAISPNEYSSTYWNSSNGSDGGSAKGYIPEQPWNDDEEFGLICTPSNSCTLNGHTVTSWATAQTAISFSAGGGGVSNCVTYNSQSGQCTSGFPQPSWQSGISANAINPSGFGVVTSPARYTPDVSLLSSANFPGYIVCTPQDELGGTSTTSACSSGISTMITNCFAGDAGFCSIFGGTSVASPVFAGIVTLLNQYLITQGIQTAPRLGNINPKLYSLAAANSTNHAFHPVTTASSGSYSDGEFCEEGEPSNQVAALQCPSTGPKAGFLGFNAYNSDPTISYNLVAGLGSVDVGNLFVAWAATFSSTTTSVGSSENPSNYGDSVTFTATVTTSGADTPTGSVTFFDGSNQLGQPVQLGCVCDGIVNPATATYTTSALSSSGSPHSITAVYGGDLNNAGSTSGALIQVVNPATFTFTSTGSASHTVLAGQTSLTYTFTATPTSGATFVNAVNIGCSFAPSDPTLTANVCSYVVNGGAVQTGTAVIPAGSATSVVTVTAQSAGPNTGTGTQFRHQSDKRLPWVPMTLPLAGVVLAGFAGRKRSKYALACSLCLALAMAGFLIACGGGGGGNSTPPISVSVGSSASSIYPQNTGWTNSTATFTATVSNDASGQGVTWSVSPTLSGQSITATDSTHATYTPPTIATGLPGSVTVTATSVAASTKSGSRPITLTPTTVPNNNPGYTVTVSATETGATTPTAPTVLLVVN